MISPSLLALKFKSFIQNLVIIEKFLKNPNSYVSQNIPGLGMRLNYLCPLRRKGRMRGFELE